MASRSDLVEAHAFHRRRLVTAFQAGAPGGREVEPTRRARVVAGGLVLAVLVVGGVAAREALTPHPDVPSHSSSAVATPP